MAKTKREGSAASRLLVLQERFPVRRIVQIALAVGIAAFVLFASWKTLTLPDGQQVSGGAWRDFIIAGVAVGSIYAMIAIGYSLVYGILLMINFAHGEVFMAGAFASFFVADTFVQNGFLNESPAIAIGVLLLVSMTVSVLVAVLLERIAYRPLRGAPRLVPLITAIGASLFLQNAFRGFFGVQTKGYPKPEILNGRWLILGVPINRLAVVVVLVAVAAMVSLTFFVSRTKTGKSMRAVSEDKEIAALMGVNVDRVIVTTFAVGGLLAGVAAVLFGFQFGFASPFMGVEPGIKAFTAAVLGGIGSIAGAALGGLILGLMENVMPALLLIGLDVPSPFQLKPVVAFSVLVLVLIFRPGGILGTGEQEKV